MFDNPTGNTALLAWGMVVTMLGTIITNLFANRKASQDRKENRADAERARQWAKEDRETERAERGLVAARVEAVKTATEQTGAVVTSKLEGMSTTLDTVHKLTNSAALAQSGLLAAAQRATADSKLAILVVLRTVHKMDPTEEHRTAIAVAEAEFASADKAAREAASAYRLKEEEQKEINRQIAASSRVALGPAGTAEDPLAVKVVE